MALGRKSDATPLAALLLGVFIYCAFAASHHVLEASQPPLAPSDETGDLASVPLIISPPAALAPQPVQVAAAPNDELPLAPQPAQVASAPTNEPRPSVTVSVQHSKELTSVFESHDYTLEDIRSGEKSVPSLALIHFPADLGQVPEVEKRKMLFIKALLPIVLQINERITADRMRATWLRDAIGQGSAITPGDQFWLDTLADRYGTAAVTVSDLDELLRRVDVVPPSLAIAQAITESGWGTSYPARVGNALFGQFHFAARGGKTAVGTVQPGTFQVRAYDSLTDAVDAYVTNLNTHPAYRVFRQQRAKLRSTGDGLDGYALANTLLRYSELGVQYVNAVRLIMRTEKLVSLDDARLDRSDPL